MKSWRGEKTCHPCKRGTCGGCTSQEPIRGPGWPRERLCAGGLMLLPRWLLPSPQHRFPHPWGYASHAGPSTPADASAVLAPRGITESGLSLVGFDIPPHFVAPCGSVFSCLLWCLVCFVMKRIWVYSWWMWSHNAREMSPFYFLFIFFKERSDYF